MFLKRIEIYGFKSFADRIELDFDKGITAVVGPNGSGKSNISDAIKWVLGEQKVKSLRGTKMEDVIFAGTVSRKPLGYAEVTLVLDNSQGSLELDYSEISVTRRLYRSGESEYLINKSHCRLKDVQDLFADTGLGKEGYSIIGQGKIDSIVSSNPQDIRHLFDEAAGIVKFKNRKAESERKLERTVDNLHRVADIISELEKQLGPLKRQKVKAQKYLELAESLKTIDLNVFVYKIEKIERELTDLEKDKDDALYNQRQKNMEMEESDKSYQQIRSRITELDEEIDDYNKKIIELSEDTEKFNTEIQVAIANIRNSENQITQWEDELSELDKSLEKSEESFEAFAEEYEKFKTELKSVNDSIAEKENEKATVQRELDLLINENADSENNYKNIEQQLVSKENEANLSKGSIVFENERIEDFRKTLQAFKSESIKLGDELISIRRESESNNTRIEKIGEKKRFKESNVEKLRIKRRDLIAQKNLLLNNIASGRSKVQFLQEDQDQKGYYKSVKNLLKLKEKDDFLRHNLHNIVGNIIKVEDEYSVAIETAIGGSMQNLVVENEASAKRCIQILNENKWGRATFLPLNNVKGNREQRVDEFRKFDGFIDIAVNLVDYDSVYEGILGNILGRVLIVEDMDAAMTINKKLSKKYKLVTLKGEIFYPGGAIVGGNFNKSNLLLQRSNHILSLKEEIKDNIGKAKDLEKDIQRTEDELNQLKDLIQKVTEDLNEEMTHKRLLEQNMLNLEKSLSETGEKVKGVESSILISLKKIQDTEENIEKIELEIEGLKERKSKIEFGAKDFEIEKLKDSLSGFMRQINELMIEKARLDTKILSQMEKREGQKNFINDLKNRYASKKNQIVNSKELVLELQKGVEEKSKFMNSSGEEKKGLQSKLDKLHEERKNQNKSFDIVDRNLKGINHESMLISESLNKLEMKINAHCIEKNHLSENMFENYQMNYMMAKELSYPVENMQLEIQKAKELKDKIKALGNINVSSIDQYKEVKERYEFLTLQKDDLLNAREELKSMIKSISKDIEVQFVEQFSLIQAQFDVTFKKLFNGGTAGLSILDDGDIMETGIEIAAQPPGKKLKNITLLSGGEKALTAIALLFAIISIKPAPFCVLDEIDAALDDSNVDRFAEFLSLITKQNQFITITHRKGTMEIADRLYGVTMGRDGVSKMLSVHISELLKEEA
ncbi:chromosome segregation protein SMC [Alkalibacter saccharofermentans]|uniref:Chromosome partition protein Smc n=1 Tax=Alkalibacter saccharofermentans DSM 14828 TaxID=1120975 RepID=A0A1M4S5L2_9FIRM|nr:chromosome segregation protein SMC [Alkalibacter saccharofermentans]SHE27493.1 condensin subunit Smc [Alkalibacter saccharofermentans DSM 14828]